MKLVLGLPVVVMALLCGCAENSHVVRAKDHKSFFEGAVYTGEHRILNHESSGSERYRVFQKGATGFVSVEIVREEVEIEAKRYCENMGQSYKVLEETTSVPPHILGNFPRAELLFVCVPKPDIVQDQLYIRLSNLKKLLDNGTLSKEEYEQQKAKVLNLP